MPEIRRESTEARLLALLTSTPGREFHTRDLVRRIEGSPRPVHLALEKLERQGLIASRRMGPLRLWHMDPKHPLYGSLRELYARTVGIAARIRDVIAAQEGVDLAFIFGSYARADDDLASDIDVLVLGKPDWGSLEGTSTKLFDELGRQVNIIGWDRSDLAQAVRKRSPFLETLRGSKKIWIVGDQDEFERRLASLGQQAHRPRAEDRAASGRDREQARAVATKPRSGSHRAARR